MKMNLKNNFFVIISVILVSAGCSKNLQVSTNNVIDLQILAYPAKDKPNAANTKVNGSNYILFNDVLSINWDIVNKKLCGNSLINKKEKITTVLPQELFTIVIGEKGEKISSLDMEIIGNPTFINSEIILHDTISGNNYPGKTLKCLLQNKEKNLIVDWQAELRDGSNYVRTSVTVKTLNGLLKIKELILIDTKLKNAKMLGNMQGAVMVSEDAFFAYEHPLAKNSNGSSVEKIGKLNLEKLGTEPEWLSFNVTNFINEACEYRPQIVAEKGRINIFEVKLLANSEVVARDEHNGFSGEKNYWNIYSLKLQDFTPNIKYTLSVLLAKNDENSNTNGIIEIFRNSQAEKVICSYNYQNEISENKSFYGSMVYGVFPEKQMRRAFLYYLERERKHEYRPFLNYNSWYDLGYFNKYDENDCIDVINDFGKELVEKRGVILDSMVFDDGWDDETKIWKFNDGFPQGFTKIAELARSYNIEPGIWLSPCGGYGKSREKRINFGRENGFEIYENSEDPYNSIFNLSGKKYYAEFSKICREMVEKYNINQFKFDGIGTNNGKSAETYQQDFETAINLFDDLQSMRSDIYINLTNGTWPSPFWLQKCDSIWRGGWDHSFLGSGSKRQQWITYRDSEIYNRIVKKSPLFPLNSIMAHGIIYAKQEKNLKTATEQDLRDEIRTMFGMGSQMQELYITPSLMNQANWNDLAEAANWARNNAEVLVDTHWIGGNPAKNEIYGFASWNKGKGALTLRNPSTKEQVITFKLTEFLELIEEDGKEFILEFPFNKKNIDGEVVKSQRITILGTNANENMTILVKPFEVLIFDVMTNLK